MDYKLAFTRRRKALHLTQRDIARKVGISENAMTNIMRGHSQPTMETFLKIAEVLGMTMLLIPKEDVDE